MAIQISTVLCEELAKEFGQERARLSPHYELAHSMRSSSSVKA